jgi:transposase
MIYRLRVVKTASGKKAVQVVRYGDSKTWVIKHLGSAANPKELIELKRLAEEHIDRFQPQRSLFSTETELDGEDSSLVLIKNLEISSTNHRFAYEVFSRWYQGCGFSILNNQLLQDLVVARLVEPASKLRSLKLLKQHFGISYSPSRLYRLLKPLPALKSRVEEVAFNYVLGKNEKVVKLVFYDVTTLYFESFKDDELRKCGFSKDHKFNQPQVIIGLLVDKQGFPLGYDVFRGNVFEGHTFIPVILRFKEKYNLDNLTVVADAAMISYTNILALRDHGLSYIVAARIASMPLETIKQMALYLDRDEKKYFKLDTKWGKLVCDFSKKRASKNKSDRLKQLRKAQEQLSKPNLVRHKTKFVKAVSKSKLVLNQALLAKAELLEGIKGYYTNLGNLPGELISQRYHDLWRVEKAFRIAKSDLLARPIYHHQETGIKAHILIVFVSLCVAKAMEMSTNLSLQKIKDLVWQIHDIELVDKLSGRTFTKRTTITDPLIHKLHQPANSTH